MTRADTIVHIDNITKRFGATTAIDQLDMEIRAGEFVTFLGPSGCGKSTTLRILGGFDTPDAGRIVLDGQDVTALPPNRRNVNMLFQDYALFPHMTARRNIAFGLELKGLSKERIRARIDELAAFLQIGLHLDRRPDELSGGQRQRVALARALAPDPSLLLLDEPLGALDAKLRGQVQDELKSIQRRTGKTFFFVTHDQDEALTMSDRIVVMNAGRVEQEGTPEDLYFQPASRFVAEFIGETNLLKGRARGADGARVHLDWHGVPLVATAQGQVPAAGASATASLRLESVRVRAGRPDTTNALEARIVNRIFKGSRVALDVVVPAAGDAALRAYADTAVARDLSDDHVWIGWHAEDMSILRD